METKHPLKSKTIESLIILFIIAILNIMGIGEAKPGKTWDTITEIDNRRGEQIKNLLMLGAIGGGVYGRFVANSKLARKKKGGEQ